MIEFTLRAECPKCGNQAFAWKFEQVRVQRGASYEVIRLTCDRCGFAVAMKPKDAA